MNPFTLMAAAWRGFGDLSWPSLEQAARRLERDSGVPHRPLTALDDRLTSGTQDRDSLELWQEHRRRLLARIHRVFVFVGPIVAYV